MIEMVSEMVSDNSFKISSEICISLVIEMYELIHDTFCYTHEKLCFYIDCWLWLKDNTFQD